MMVNRNRFINLDLRLCINEINPLLVLFPIQRWHKFCNFVIPTDLQIMRYSLYIFVLAFILVSCAKEDESNKTNVGSLTNPIASFSFSGNDGPAPVTVTFTNTSQYSDAYEWDFGDGSPTSNTHSPTHKYYNTSGEPKSFLVKLTATDTQSGLSNTRSKSIKIDPSN